MGVPDDAERLREAEAAFREAVRLDHGSTAAHANLASTVLARKRGSWLKAPADDTPPPSLT